MILAAAIGGLLAGSTPLVVQAAGPGDATTNLTTVSDGFELAADGTPSVAISSAQFFIDGGTLALMQVPDLTFGRSSVGALIQGPQTLHLQAGSIPKDSDAPGFDGSANQQIVVRDFRGTNAGWTLTAQLGQFKNLTSAKTLTATKATLGDGGISGDNVQTIALANADFTSNATAILTAPVERGSGTTTAQLADATIDLPQTVNATAGEYRAPLNWVLGAQPTPTAP